MHDNTDHVQSISPDELLNRLAEVTAMLHHEQGNREELQVERTKLVGHARRMGLFQPRSAAVDSDHN